MSEIMIDEIPLSETDHIMTETGINNEDEETWLYGSMMNESLFEISIICYFISR
jgi:hypothetical protein